MERKLCVFLNQRFNGKLNYFELSPEEAATLIGKIPFSCYPVSIKREGIGRIDVRLDLNFNSTSRENTLIILNALNDMKA